MMAPSAMAALLLLTTLLWSVVADPGFGLPSPSLVSPSDSEPFANVLDDEIDDWDTNSLLKEHDSEQHYEAAPFQSSLLQVPCGLQQQHDEEDEDFCKICPVAAFVDTGAQVTVLSKAAAERTGLLRLMDRRYAGHATGVGQCRVLGRIPANSLWFHMGDALLKGPAITVLESTGTDGVDLLLGLDFLRDHRAILSLHDEEMMLFLDQPNPVVIPFIRPRRGISGSSSAAATSHGGGVAYNEKNAYHPRQQQREDVGEANVSDDGDYYYGDDDFHEAIDLSGV